MNSENSITVLYFGDIIGKPGRRVIKRYLRNNPNKADLIIANAENAAHGFGTTFVNVEEMKAAGVQVFTGGNHTFDRKEIFEFIDADPILLRPANYPQGTPGVGHCLVDTPKGKVGILNVMGRVFMEPLASPFTTADELIPILRKETNVIIVDIHAEATAEKVALGWYLDGRASAVIGSHTHIQTADERILPGGTAYLTDAGCCGPRDGVIGMEREGVFRRLVKQLPTRFEVAPGPAALMGVFLTIDRASGKAEKIERVQFFETAEDVKEEEEQSKERQAKASR